MQTFSATIHAAGNPQRVFLSMSLRRPVTLALALAAAACAPAVTHGPRVEPGPALFATIGAPRPLCSGQSIEDCAAGMLPTWGIGVHYGLVPAEQDRPSLLAGFNLPVLDPLGGELDAFVEAPSPGVWTGGVGVLSSARHLVPYAQLGQMPNGGGNGWYAQLAYARLLRDPHRAVDDVDSVSGGMARPPRFWSPGGGVRLNRNGALLTFYVNAAFGSYVDREFTYAPFDPAAPQQVDTTDIRKRVRTLFLGVTWERPFRDLHFPGRMLPPRTPPTIP